MRLLWIVPLALVIGAVAMWALTTVEPSGPPGRQDAARSEPVAAPPRDHIGENSREALRQILRDADAAEPEAAPDPEWVE